MGLLDNNSIKFFAGISYLNDPVFHPIIQSKVTPSSPALISSDTPDPGATITFIISSEFSNS